ncbi:DEAD/DEAH box helicase [Patescibacteria group bacterium]|nr:DEAD/DEAH box helicase [Patescibacteria group bacterium]MBU1028807.1 DEAD/DEAH box helicase [Patescibacteria group bacterium]
MDFESLGISPKILAVLTAAGFKKPTPIQHQAIPIALTGQDIVGLAQTGTGKTIAFAVPMLQRISREGGQGLVLLPTRELALQVDEEYQKLAKRFGLRTAILIGGASMNVQHAQLKRRPHVIVATPGRLIDLMERRWIALDKVNVLVLDEADRMLDMGFMPQIRRILKQVSVERQTMLFSATMPSEIEKLAQQFMRTPERIEAARAGRASDLVEQSLFVVPKPDKIRLLKYLLKEESGTVLVFSRTKFGAKRIARDLVRVGESATEIHSNLTLAQRRKALDGFKSGKYRVLVATDIAARGIDVTGISLVVNFDLPEAAEDYIHRIGRTGRAECQGKAISFAEPDQGLLVTAIEHRTQVQLRPQKLPITTSMPIERPNTLINKRKPARRPGPKFGRRPGGGQPSGGRPGGARPSGGRPGRGGGRPPRPSSHRRRK